MSQRRQALQTAGLSRDASTDVTSLSPTVRLWADKAYLAVDSATSGTGRDQGVDSIACVLRTLPNLIRVDGFTDTQPITGGSFTSTSPANQAEKRGST